MTKKEEKAFADLKRQLLEARALRRTEPVKTDLHPASLSAVEGLGFISGFIYYPHALKVEPAWSQLYGHGRGTPRPCMNRVSSQNGISLYSSRALALKAMRYEIETKAMKDLADIDEEIAEAEAGAGND